MNLIKQLGGYERAKAFLNAASYTMDELIMMQRSGVRPQHVEKALLEYRRQHNIFEVGDKVVSINSAFIEYQGVLNIDFIDKFNLMLSDDSKGFEVNAICGWGEIIRHANDEEIKAGKRLEVNQ
ncbi:MULTISPECIES: hypothetical protein [Acinetobacter]|uniref:hypothetical protein n=1 Tax=Acinetobacter TaxID=469 RepID=UPI0021CDC5DB|nr:MULTISPECIES: hypothetical protein [Acinetobacter]MCU4364677.1 hypothetical protein [Acinetobacter variabilis]